MAQLHPMGFKKGGFGIKSPQKAARGASRRLPQENHPPEHSNLISRSRARCSKEVRDSFEGAPQRHILQTTSQCPAKEEPGRNQAGLPGLGGQQGQLRGWQGSLAPIAWGPVAACARWGPAGSETVQLPSTLQQKPQRSTGAFNYSSSSANYRPVTFVICIMPQCIISSSLRSL